MDARTSLRLFRHGTCKQLHRISHQSIIWQRLDANCCAAGQASCHCDSLHRLRLLRGQIKWILTKFELLSFLPWSDVRKVKSVTVGEQTIHITQALGDTRGGGGGRGSRRGSRRESRRSSRSSARRDSSEDEGANSEEGPRRRSRGGRIHESDGDEWDRVAQKTLESVLGQQFADKYQVLSIRAPCPGCVRRAACSR